MLYGSLHRPIRTRTYNHSNIVLFIWKNRQSFQIVDSLSIKKLFLLSFSYIYLSSWILDFKKVTHFIDCFQGLLNDYIVRVNSLFITTKTWEDWTSFLYWLDWKSKQFQQKLDVTENYWMKSYLVGFKSFQRKIEWEPCKRVKIPYKPLKFCGLSTLSIQTLYFRWYLKRYHFAIFLL